VLVELSVMEQRYQAVLAVVQDGWQVSEVARRLGPSSPPEPLEFSALWPDAPTARPKPSHRRH
jgi:hypothetical protein